MKNANFQELYRQTFSSLGFNLTERDQIPENTLRAAEEKINSRIPQSLRDYYVVAGRETKLNTAFNRLVPPEDWKTHDGRLIFMTGNQSASVWGVGLKMQPKNPKVFKSLLEKGEPGIWSEEIKSCSRFLVFNLHLQCANGGMPFHASAALPEKQLPVLEGKWFFVGEVSGIRAYNGPGQAIWISKQPDLSTGAKGWRICGGASSEASLDSIAKGLGIDWED